MDTCNIYIIESASRELGVNSFDESGKIIDTEFTFQHRVNFNNVENLKERIKQYYNVNNVNIHLVDSILKKEFFQTEEGKQYFESLKEVKNNLTVYPMSWESFLEHNSISTETWNIFATYLDIPNLYLFANIIGVKLTKNNLFISNLDDIGNVENAKTVFNVFNVDIYDDEEHIGDDFTWGGNEANIFLKYTIKNGVEHFRELIKAGVLDNERHILSNIKPWALNIKTLFMDGVIRENNLIIQKANFGEWDISNGDLPQELFNTSSLHRKTILETMILALHNYFSNNFGNIGNIEDIKDETFFDEVLKKI